MSYETDREDNAYRFHSAVDDELPAFTFGPHLLDAQVAFRAKMLERLATSDDPLQALLKDEWARRKFNLHARNL